MFKRIGIIALTLASLLAGPSTAMAQAPCECIDIVMTRMYSDATHTVQVGYISGYCSWNGVQYQLFGTYTYFQVDEVIGSCGCGPIE